jgi:hypothetical protein
MNIKILEPIKEELVIATFPFGSACYNTLKEGSDRDYLKLVSFKMGDILLQYQEPGKDYVYTDTTAFFNDIISGKSTINFEVLHTPEFHIWYGKSIIDLIPYYYTNRIARAYIGFAKRDLEFPERIFHVNRGLYLADKVVKKEPIILADIANIPINNDIEYLRSYIEQKRKEIPKNG